MAGVPSISELLVLVEAVNGSDRLERFLQLAAVQQLERIANALVLQNNINRSTRGFADPNQR